MKILLEYLKKSLGFLLKNKRRGFFSALCVGYGIYYFHLNLFGKKYRISKCRQALLERFNFSGKYLDNPNSSYDFSLCTIFPSNIFDSQKALEIANKFKIPIIYDVNAAQNLYTMPHFKIDMSKYNQIKLFDERRKIITVEPGVKISDLQKYLEEHNFTVPLLQKYKYSDLTVSDVVFNNFYGFHEGKFIDDAISEITVVTPKNEKIYQFKQNDDFTLNELNMKSLFLRSNSVLGVIIELQFKIKQLRKLKYINISGLENTIQEALKVVKDLKEVKKESGMNDIVILSNGKDKEISILFKMNEEKFSERIEEFKSAGLRFELMSEDEYFKALDLNVDTKPVLRKFKVFMSKQNIPAFIKKLEVLMKENDMHVPVRVSYVHNEVEISLPATDDIKIIERSYMFLNRVHADVRKLKGNIFVNNNIKVNTKYHLMREIGLHNYFLNEDVKEYFDPHNILNPHLSILKPEFFKYIKRSNKIWNYLLTKIEV